MNTTLAICNEYRLDLADYHRTGLRVGIWASSGRGKSFGVGVLCEELLAASIPVIAIDPEGELHTLREHYRVLVVGGDRGDLPLPPGQEGVRLTLEHALDQRLGLVIDLSDKPSSKGQQEAALPWLEALWVLLSQRRTPAALVVEEVHLFAPQSGSSVTADIMQRFAKQGRKRGAILVAASQRTQAVSKEFMSQLNFSAIGGFETERDFEAVKFFVEGQTFETFRTLEPGRFYLSAAKQFHTWRPRLTSHGGDAPTWEAAPEEQAPVRDSAMDEIVRLLTEAFAVEERTGRQADTSAPERARIKELEAETATLRTQLAEAQGEVTRLKTALQVAGLVKVLITQEVITKAADLPVAVPATTAPAPAKVEVTATTATAQPVSIIRDVKLHPDAILAVPEIKAMVKKARERAQRQRKGASAWCEAVAKSLARGKPLQPAGLAGDYGYHGAVTIRRIEVCMDCLVNVGYASYKSGWYRLNEAHVTQLIMRT